MKNILLIGDSILVGSNQTSGYGTIVRDMLKDKANVIELDTLKKRRNTTAEPSRAEPFSRL